MRTALTICLLALLSPSQLQAQPTAAMPDPMKGIKSFAILADVTGDAVGLTPTRLASLVEHRVRQAGITIEPKVSPPFHSFLYFQVRAKKITLDNGEPAGCAGDLGIELFSLVTIKESNGVAIVPVWRRGGVAMGSAQGCVATIEKYATQEVDSFLNDYLKMNPRTAR